MKRFEILIFCDIIDSLLQLRCAKGLVYLNYLAKRTHNFAQTLNVF